MLALAAALAGCDSKGKTDWEQRNDALLDKDADPLPPPPAFPKRAALIEFEATRATRDFRYFIDGANLSVDAKGVVRYTLVVRSTSGVDNVSFEAINCKSDEYRIFALGQADGTWGGRAGGWRPIRESRQPQHRALHRDYFCPQSNPIADAGEGLRALREGGHPWRKGFSGDALLGR